ncbi:MAG: dipeptidase, partial [Muribaculaceae bacterium]|nr:dipeptidase [Muribaculaceae bacterium]
MDKESATDYLHRLTDSFTADATAQYKALGDYLLVKYLDGNIKKEENGRFARTPEGMPVQPEFGGYNERYFRSVANDAGERLRVNELDQN